MTQYIIRRLLLGALTLFLASVFIFLAVRIFPGDPAMAMLAVQSGDVRSVSEKELQKVRQQTGLDKPLTVQYFTWVRQIATLNLGKSWILKRPVTQELKERIPYTAQLAVLSIAFAMALAVSLGALAAMRQDTWVDHIVRTFSIVGLTMPTFWSATLIILLLVIFFGWIPPLGYVPLWERPVEALQQLVWPVLALGIYYMGSLARLTRSAMLEVLRSDYVRTAYSKGLRERVVIGRHALRNALLPVITLSSLQFAYLLGGSVIVESVFNLPGLGSGFLEAVRWRDFPMVQNMVMVFAGVVILINLAVDVAYTFIDPRVRLR